MLATRSQCFQVTSVLSATLDTAFSYLFLRRTSDTLMTICLPWLFIYKTELKGPEFIVIQGLYVP